MGSLFHIRTRKRQRLALGLLLGSLWVGLMTYLAYFMVFPTLRDALAVATPGETAQIIAVTTLAALILVGRLVRLIPSQR